MKTDTPLRFATCLCILALVVPLSAAAEDSSALTTEQIVAEAIAAAGGDALDAVTTIRRKGDIHLESDMFGIVDGSWEVAFVPGEKGYQLADFGAAATATGWDGTTGWENSAMGLRDISPGELALNRVGWELNILHALSREGMATDLQRIDDASIDGRPHYVLEHAGEGDAKTQIWIDIKTSLISRVGTSISSPQGVAAVTIDLADYGDVDGIRLPQLSTQTIENLWVVTMTYTDTEIDPEVDAAIFAKP